MAQPKKVGSGFTVMETFGGGGGLRPITSKVKKLTREARDR